MDELLVSPLHAAAAPSLPLPPGLFGPGRRNSAGVDLADARMRAPLLAALETTPVATVPLAEPAQLPAAFARSQAAFPAWRNMPVATRSAILCRAADAMEAQLHRCARDGEGRSILGDAVSEVGRRWTPRYTPRAGASCSRPTCRRHHDIALASREKPTRAAARPAPGLHQHWIFRWPLPGRWPPHGHRHTVLAKPAEKPRHAQERCGCCTPPFAGDVMQSAREGDTVARVWWLRGHRGRGLTGSTRWPDHQARAGGATPDRAADCRNRRHTHACRLHRAPEQVAARGAERLPLGGNAARRWLLCVTRASPTLIEIIRGAAAEL